MTGWLSVGSDGWGAYLLGGTLIAVAVLILAVLRLSGRHVDGHAQAETETEDATPPPVEPVTWLIPRVRDTADATAVLPRMQQAGQ